MIEFEVPVLPAAVALIATPACDFVSVTLPVQTPPVNAPVMEGELVLDVHLEKDLVRGSGVELRKSRVRAAAQPFVGPLPPGPSA
ncbi:MAG TPA: hypothetical protein PKL57_19595, partial [Candidatus Wallbacteria bacterium]|nr:hypothetical protein [Candidatus Wallbacteria bacterium]